MGSHFVAQRIGDDNALAARVGGGQPNYITDCTQQRRWLGMMDMSF
ncbi:MAG: hypothetical protein IAE83_07080 [Anaerolinea sp.]|nr:hypothetical protein [Anaerolinea sp.]